MILARLLPLLLVVLICAITIVKAARLEPGHSLKLVYWLAGNISPQEAQALNVALRKEAHVLLYAVVAGGLFLALATRRSALLAGLLAWLGATAWGIVDEWHQSHVVTRTASVRDVYLDAIGAAMAVLFLWGLWFLFEQLGCIRSGPGSAKSNRGA